MAVEMRVQFLSARSKGIIKCGMEFTLALSRFQRQHVFLSVSRGCSGLGTKTEAAGVPHFVKYSEED